ncbi:MAG: hypothetical protein RIS41_1694 [Actinomycetota bacterium]|jgi:hypothetical protein
MPNVHVIIAPFTTWSPTGTEYPDLMAVVPFLSASGDVIAVEPQIDYQADDLVRVRFELDEGEWERVVEHDVFGARTRRRFPDQLEGSGGVTLTVEGSRLATESPRGWSADDFVVVSAMRRIDGNWHGQLFASPPAWWRAIDSLVQLGFVVDGETDDEVSATNHLGVNAMISVYSQNQVAAVVYAAPAEASWTSDPAVLDLLNRLNASFVIGSVALQVNDVNQAHLLTKASIPMLDGVDVPQVLDALVIGLTGMIIEVEPVVRAVAQGTMAVDDAARRLT